jgi:hypothetical protein
MTAVAVVLVPFARWLKYIVRRYRKAATQRNMRRGQGGSGIWSLVRKKSQKSGKSGETGQATRDLSICSTFKKKLDFIFLIEK